MEKKIVILLIGLTMLSACKTETKTEISAIKETEITKNNLKQTIIFPSLDGLTITADIYKVDNNPITILLCHQAGFSRGEYKDTALLFNSYGYSVMAIDQRSGEGVNNVVNETAKLAKSKDVDTNYIDAKPDIIAAIDYIYKENGKLPITLVGSSYSATLAMLIGKDNDKVKAIAAFSPGEYYKGMSIQNEIKNLTKPTFVTASFSETKDLTTLVSKMKTENLIHYKPTEDGIHGSRALWTSTKGYKDYREKFKIFLESM